VGGNSTVAAKQVAGLSDRLDVTVELDEAGAAAVAEHATAHLPAQLGHLRSPVGGEGQTVSSLNAQAL
jgi:hypothetical protein